MNLNSKSLVGTPVRTRSGMPVGKLASLDFEADTGRLAMLRIRVRGVVPGLLDNEALVAWPQVVSLGEREIVVEDAVAKRGTATLARKEMHIASAHLKERTS
jgi:sporulation protein YlmC with PRC-barrel domain